MNKPLGLIVISAAMLAACQTVTLQPMGPVAAGHLEKAQYAQGEPVIELPDAEEVDVSGVLLPNEAQVLLASRSGHLGEMAQQLEAVLAQYESGQLRGYSQWAAKERQLALVYIEQNRMEDARQSILQSERLLKSRRPQDDWALAQNSLLRARLALVNQEFDQAEAWLGEALRTYERHPNQTVEERLTVMVMLANLYRNQGQVNRAKQVYLEALMVVQGNEGSASPMGVCIHSQLADLYYGLHDPVQAKIYYNKALAMAAQLGQVNPRLLGQQLFAMAQFYYHEHNQPLAEQYFKQAYFYLSKGNPVEHPDLARNLTELSSVYIQDEPYTAARMNMHKAMAPSGVSLHGIGDPEGPPLRLVMEYQTGVEHQQTLALAASDAHSQWLDWLGYEALQHQRFDQAQEYYSQRLAELKGQYGTQSVMLIPSYVQLAEVARSRGDYPEAEALVNQALSLVDPQDALAWVDYATLYKRMAKIRQDQGYYLDAESWYKKALAYNRHFYPQGALTGDERMDLASIYLDQNRFSPLIYSYRQMGQELERSYGPDKPILGQYYDDMGAIAEKSMHFDVARRYYKRALAMRQRQLGTDNSEVMESHLKLAQLYMQTGWVHQADHHISKAVRLAQTNLGAESVAYWHTQVAQGDLQRAEFALGSAKAYYETALAGLEKQAGLDYPETIAVLFKLAETEQLMGDTEKAELHYKAALARGETIWGQESPKLIPILIGYAHLKHEPDGLRTRWLCLSRASAIAHLGLTADHPLAIAAQYQLADYYTDTRQWKLAQSYYRDVVKRYAAHYDGVSPDVVWSYYYLSQFAITQKRMHDARYLYGEATRLNDTMPTAMEVDLPPFST